MQKTISEQMLSELFIYKQFENGTGRLVYSDKYILAEAGTVERDLYELVSNIAQNSGMSFEFSYNIMSQACTIASEYLLNSEGDEDNINELVDNAVPIYNNELMQIYVSDWSIVDEAHDELGGSQDDSVGRAQLAWYYILERVTREVIENVSDYNNGEI